MSDGLIIVEDDITGPEVIALLQEHLDEMHTITPPESVHALDLDGLRQPHITFWSAWKDQQLAGCGALKELSPRQGEIKSMRTPLSHRKQGVAAALLAHIISIGRKRHYQGLFLETGSMQEFAPARTLYEQFGFVYCGPFADYQADPNSSFMTLNLRD